MLPFLLDDVTRLHHSDILRELEADLKAAQLPRRTRRRSRLRRLAGQLFVAAGTLLLETRELTAPTARNAGFSGDPVRAGSADC